MAGHEILGRHQLEGQPEESRLPQTEIGQRAYQLIKDFKQRIKRTPEFAQALQGEYFDEASHGQYSSLNATNSFRHQIRFEKGGYRYSIQYTIQSEREELHVTKSPIKPAAHDRWREAVDLEAGINEKSRQFDHGIVAYIKFDIDRTKDTSSLNTPTAIHKAEDFLTASFGKGEQQ